jgi:hypothetical protein
MAASNGHYAMRTKTIAVVRRAYLVNEACVALGIARSNAYSMMRSGALPYVEIGGRRHIAADVIEALVKGEHPGQASNPTRRRKRGAAA